MFIQFKKERERKITKTKLEKKKEFPHSKRNTKEFNHRRGSKQVKYINKQKRMKNATEIKGYYEFLDRR